MDLKYIVYITINLCNGKFYIGVHNTNPNTFDGYIGCGVYRQSNATGKKAFHAAVRKYGYDNFKRTTLRVFDTEQEAYDFERQLVTETVLKSKNCYNMCIGGKGGSALNCCKRVYKFTLNGEFLQSYKNTREAAMSISNSDTDTVRQAIKNNCRGSVQTAYGYFWSYEKKFKSPTNDCWKPVAQYSLTGKFIRSYSSIAQAAHDLNITTISQALMKDYSAGGYYWKYYIGDNSDISYYKERWDNLNFPIIMINKKTGEQKLYCNIQDCVNNNSELDYSQISRVIRGIIKSHKGYYFKRQDKDIV